MLRIVSTKFIENSSHFRQRTTQLLCGAEERILGCLFRRTQHFADGAQLEPLIMFQLKHHALARREPV